MVEGFPAGVFVKELIPEGKLPERGSVSFGMGALYPLLDHIWTVGIVLVEYVDEA